MKPYTRSKTVQPGKAWGRHAAIAVLAITCIILIPVATDGFSCLFADPQVDGSVVVMTDLLPATESPETASALDMDRFLSGRALPDSGSDMWPVYRFLLAEVYRLRGENDVAYRFFSDLAASALEYTGSDGPAGGGLGAASLVRSVQLLGATPQPEAEEVRRLIRLSGPFLTSRPPQGMFEIPVLGGLPRIKETFLRQLALLAWSIGDEGAGSLIFMKYLEIASVVDLGRDGIELVDYLVSHGRASEGEIALMRGRRFYALRRYEDARRFLNDARAGSTTEIRARAGYYLARTRSIQGAPRIEVINLLTSALEETADPGLIQEILFYRATIFNREGRDRDIDRFIGDLADIIRRFPDGATADDALFEMAIHYDVEGDAENALLSFARLRDHKGPNDRIDSAYFRAALILYSRGDPGDIEGAARLLERLIDLRPAGDLSLAARFWLGRMASERGDSISARSHFHEVIEAIPYDYYAIRARMHLNTGPDAAGEVWADSGTLAEIMDAYGSGTIEIPFQDDPPQHRRMRGALEGGLYAWALSAERRLSHALPSKRLNDLTVDDLDRTGTFAAISLLLSLREDAIGAAIHGDKPRDRFSVASLAGLQAGDWPLSMLLVFGLDRSAGTQSAIQHDPHYLAVAYPRIYADLITEAANANGVPPELLYGVIRRESLFYPAALSSRGALGLFQFIPSTFAALNDRWSLLGSSGAASMEAFLSDTRLTIDLGARWFAEELLKRNNGNILLAVMEHNAGYPAVKSWRETWDRSGRNADVEYMVETARFAETRIFARSVLADMVIARAAGMFPTPEGADDDR